MQLEPVLVQLSAQLERLHAPVLALLQPGLDLPQIQALLAELPLRPPAEVYRLFQWRNGVHEDHADQQPLFPDGSFFALETALQEYRQQLTIAGMVAAQAQIAPEELWHPAWLPLFGAAGGDTYVVQCGEHEADSAPIFLIDNDTRAAVQIYDHLAGMIAVIVECYQRGVYTFEDGMVRLRDPHAAAQISREHNPGSAHWLMAQAGDAHSAEDLVHALQSDDSALREQAAQALLRLRDREAIPGLIQSLGSPAPSVRSLAARLLGALGDTSAADALTASLRDPDAGVRGAAAQSLGELRASQAATSLLQTLHDDDPTVKVKSIWAIGQISSPQAVDPLVGLLRHTSPSIRLEATKALGAIGDRRATPALLESLRDPVLDVQQLAAHALGELGDPAALPALQELLRHPHPLLRSIVHTAIEQLTRDV